MPSTNERTKERRRTRERNKTIIDEWKVRVASGCANQVQKGVWTNSFENVTWKGNVRIFGGKTTEKKPKEKTGKDIQLDFEHEINDQMIMITVQVTLKRSSTNWIKSDITGESDRIGCRATKSESRLTTMETSVVFAFVLIR